MAPCKPLTTAIALNTNEDIIRVMVDLLERYGDCANKNKALQDFLQSVYNAE